MYVVYFLYVQQNVYARQTHVSALLSSASAEECISVHSQTLSVWIDEHFKAVCVWGGVLVAHEEQPGGGANTL